MYKKNNKIKLSIIVPMYNCEKFIYRCLDSIFKQINDSVECILVDDGSTDNSGFWYSKFVNLKQMKVFRQANKGVSFARAAGLKIAKGDYVWFVDSDDMIQDNAITHIINIINKWEPGMYCFNYFMKCHDGSLRKVDPFPYKGFINNDKKISKIYPNLIHDSNFLYFAPSLCNKVIRKSILKNNMLVDKDATIGEDQATVIMCVVSTSNLYIDTKYLYYYCHNPTSATRYSRPFNRRYPYVVNKYLFDRLNSKSYDFKKQICIKIVHDLFNMSYSQFYSDESYREVCLCLRKIYSKKFYLYSIENTHCSVFKKLFFVRVCIKFRLFFIIKLYSVLKLKKHLPNFK